jgi:hypothetical protein
MAPRKKRIVTDEHKAAMAEGRTQSRAVSSYLEALEMHRPKRGRKRTTDSIDKRLATIETELPTANPIKRLSLIQERLDLTNERGTLGTSVDISEYEDEFVAAAGTYSQRKGISYSAWRELGVPPSVLKRAGISRSA